jgi:hypothetical protein
MGFWMLVTSTHWLMKLSRNTIPTAVCNKCLGGNHWRSPPRSLWATALTVRGLLFTVPMWTITATTGRRTIGNAADNVCIALWGFCPLFSRCHAVFRQPLPRSMDRTKRTSCVASAISRSHSCRLLLVGPSEEHRLRPTMNMREELWNYTEAVGTTIRNMPDVLKRTRKSWCKRAQLCIDCNGGPFQHVL